MRVLGNILWHFPFMGFLFSLFYCITGVLLCCTVILIPLGRGYFQMAKFMLSPFSYRMVSRKDLVWIGRSTDGAAMAAFSLVIRILYFPFGLLAAFSALFVIIGEALTIIGIPFAIIWSKLFTSIFNPINKVCIGRDDAELIARRKAENRAANNGRLVRPGSDASEAEDEEMSDLLGVSFRNLKKAPLYALPSLAVFGIIPLVGQILSLVAGIGTIVVAVREKAYRLPLLLIGIGVVLYTLLPIALLFVVASGLVEGIDAGWRVVLYLPALPIVVGAILLLVRHREKPVVYGAVLSLVGSVFVLLTGVGLHLIIAQILSEKEGFEKLA